MFLFTMKKIISFFIFFFIFSSIFAQTGTIRGFVYDKSTGEPIMFCNVFLKGTTIGAPTYVNGMYNIAKVKSGDYQLVVTYLGYDTTHGRGFVLKIKNYVFVQHLTKIIL